MQADASVSILSIRGQTHVQTCVVTTAVNEDTPYWSRELDIHDESQ